MKEEILQRVEMLESEVERIHARNVRVELEKGWELSKTRLLSVSVLTYLVIVLVLWTIGGPNPPVHAIVPTVGFMLSTITMPFLKRRWMERQR